MRIAKIYSFDVVNGIGIGMSIFLQGCPHRCKGCFNPETWSFSGGVEFTPEMEQNFLDLCITEKPDFISFLGGEPFEQLKEISILIEKIKLINPDIVINMWTGYEMKEIELALKMYNSKIDNIIDGRYIEEEKDLKLNLRGSRNQNIYRLKNNTYVKENDYGK